MVQKAFVTFHPELNLKDIVVQIIGSNSLFHKRKFSAEPPFDRTIQFSCFSDDLVKHGFNYRTFFHITYEWAILGVIHEKGNTRIFTVTSFEFRVLLNIIAQKYSYTSRVSSQIGQIEKWHKMIWTCLKIKSYISKTSKYCSPFI